MNWTDLIVVAVIAVFALLGLRHGLIHAVFKVFSFFFAVFAAIKFHPVLTNMLKERPVYETIKNSIYKNITKGAEQNSEGIVETLKLPDFLKNILIDDMGNFKGTQEYRSVAQAVSEQLAEFVLSIISVVLIYIAARIVLMFLQFLLKGAARLPVIKQMDKIGGFAVGALEGVLTIYVLFAILALFASASWSENIFVAVEKSWFAEYFYEHNFIINTIFPK